MQMTNLVINFSYSLGNFSLTLGTQRYVKNLCLSCQMKTWPHKLKEIVTFLENAFELREQSLRRSRYFCGDDALVCSNLLLNEMK